jgi:hypothetical protein
MKRRTAMQRIVASSLALGFLAILSFGAQRAWADPCGGPTPCDCGDTVTEDHTLPGDLTCPGDGLIVAAGKVLDLGGHDLTGPGPDTGRFGVKLNSGSQVKDGRIQNFGLGITSAGHLTSCAIGNGVTTLVVTINGIGIGLRADGCEIVKTTVVSNEGDGVTIAGNGNTLTQNTCSRNGGDGMSIAGDDNVLLSNRCELNGGDGITVVGNENTLEKNLGGRNDGSGVIADGTGNKFRRNQGRTNDGDGVRGTGADLETDGRNYGNANGGTNCEIDGHPTTGGGKYC